jgi:hypothetical protein
MYHYNNTLLLIIEANEMQYFSALFGKEFYMFQTDLLSSIKSLNTVFEAISKGKVHPCTGTEAVYRPYCP